MLETQGVVGLLQRMVALGVVALGQTFTIIAGSIDLSVANLISVAAVLASFIMQGRTEMMLPAIAVVLVVSALVGAVNGALVSRLQVNPLIATLGVGLILQGMLSASFTDFAGSVPRQFEAVAYGSFGAVPYSVAALFALAAVASIVLRATRFGAHLYAVGGNAEGARLAGIRTYLVTTGAHVVCSLAAGATGLYLASRLRSGAPWIGRDGVYDLESIAVVVIGGTRRRSRRRLGHARRGAAVRLARCLVQHDGGVGLSETRSARRYRDRRGRALRRPHAGSCRMTLALEEARRRSRAIELARQVNIAVAVFLAVYLTVGPLAADLPRAGGNHEFPQARRAAGHSGVRPALRARQRRLRPLGRIVGDADRDRRVDAHRQRPLEDVVGDRRRLCDRPRRRPDQRSRRRLSSDALDHRHARDSVVC
jgi:ribose/xylose/arabinose/galactoside ABC-type transport system permease subunit